ncbi:Nucleotide-binding universal stress protein, UspA family [Streptomyces sp. SceaMP-e96]|uniref:universal stress protein n=1 Tax=unclassified Streptomyces TaxID=2593676 RepID=UPI0008238A74|nr:MULTISPECIES: universal stress protein [unclassified Streptomyces]MYT16752.1 universal stress protein [Streptomyces sp. SID4951]SCK34914.1 Nucleotide-binding universal stress protein, UspA family [Streptomyces sp. SceaMP-e96]
MERPLVVGVDGSDAGFLALDWAVDEAALHELPLRLVHASRWERYEDAAPTLSLKRPAERVLADNIVGAAIERVHLRNAEVNVSTQVLADDPETVLLREAEHVSAVIVGSRGRGAFTGLLLGSVGLAVAGRARCPVIVVRGDKAGLAGTHERVLLGVGEAAKGSEAVRFAFREAQARGCTLDAVRAWRCPAHETADHPLLAGSPERYHEDRASAVLDEALEEMAGEYPTVRVRRVTVEGPAHKVLMRRSAAADLLVIGAQRRDGHLLRDGRLGLQLGRVAHAVLHHAECPVAVVPQPA